MILRGLAIALALWGTPALAGLGDEMPLDARVTVLDYSDLNNWAVDDHEAALSVFLDTCIDLDEPQWAPLCAVAQRHVASGTSARAFLNCFSVLC